MINYTLLDSKGQSKDGKAIVDYLMATEELTDYYTGVENDTCQRWWGKGHEALGLKDTAVTREVMSLLCQGFAPDGTPLCRNAGAKPREEIVTDPDGTTRTVWVGGRRVGADVTFSPPKDVSVAFAVANTNERGIIFDCHRRAVNRVMDEIENIVETRLGEGGKNHEQVKGLLASQHDHLCNRELEPDIHTHVLLYNLAMGEDGKWRTFDAEELLRYRVALDAVYQSELACNLRDAGFVMDQVMEEDKWGAVKRSRIRGVSDELIDAFSQRRQAILDYAEKHGVSTQQASLATRKHKDEPSFEEMRAMWTEVVQGIDPSLLTQSLIHDVDRTEAPVVLPKRSMDELAAALHDSDAGRAKTAQQKHETGAGEALVSEKDLWLLLAREHMGEIRLDDLKERAQAFVVDAGLEQKESKQLAEEDRGERVARRYREPRYQAASLAEKERYIVERGIRSTTEDHLRLSPQSLNDAMAAYEQRKGFTLNAEQRASLEHTTIGTGGIAVIQGYAGTGKTTVAEVYKDAFEREGYTLLGVAVSSKAAMKLQEESKMPCDSMTSTLMRLESGALTLTSKHVVVVDEAGMVGTVHMAGLMKHCEAAGCKLVVQGDDNQLSAVQAGNGLSLLKESIGSAVMKDIRRQKNVEDRDIALSYYANADRLQSKREERALSEQIMSQYKDRGYLHGYNTLDEAKTGLVKAYLADERPTDQKIILAHKVDDTRSLNQAIRQELKARNEVGSYDFDVKCYHRGEWVDRVFSKGDRIRFLSRNNDLGVVNNSEGKILGIHTNYAGSLDITVETDNGRTVTFDSREYSAIDHNYAVTVHKSQGQTKDSVYHLVNVGMSDKQASLVAFTRMREEYKMFGTQSDIEQITSRLAKDRKKENALQSGTVELEQVRQRAQQEAQKREAMRRQGIQR